MRHLSLLFSIFGLSCTLTANDTVKASSETATSRKAIVSIAMERDYAELRRLLTLKKEARREEKDPKILSKRLNTLDDSYSSVIVGVASSYLHDEIEALIQKIESNENSHEGASDDKDIQTAILNDLKRAKEGDITDPNSFHMIRIIYNIKQH